MSDPLLLITMGDAAGIGPEVIVKALAEPVPGARVAVVGSPRVLALARAIVQCEGSTPGPLPLFVEMNDPASAPRGAIPILTSAPELEATLDREKLPGEITGRAAVSAIEKAVAIALSGGAEALVTAPVSKEALHKAGARFPGQTEFLAALTKTSLFCMAFDSDALRVALVTTHIALRDVPDAVTAERVAGTILVFDRALRRDFDVARPRLAVCALNPHAGEGGLFGREDAQRVAPGVESARAAGVDVSGPYPGDTIFRRAATGEFDGVVALYHDQGLAPVKALGISVNVTLGLPIVRTSPDHGTALDIAGRGIADARPMRRAILTAARMAHARRKTGAETER